jgi:hypothetical protein
MAGWDNCRGRVCGPALPLCADAFARPSIPGGGGCPAQCPGGERGSPSATCDQDNPCACSRRRPTWPTCRCTAAVSSGNGGPRVPRLGTANERNQLVERPLPDEIVPTLHTQRGEHGAHGPFYRPDHRRLDLRTLVREIDQDDVADLKPLNLDIERHQASVLRWPRPEPVGVSPGCGQCAPPGRRVGVPP